jgi:hypothetical protein
LDAQLDTGAMHSCAKFDAIPELNWQPVHISFTIVNKTNIPIKGFALDFLLFLNGLKTTVNSYCFYIGSHILLDYDYVNKYIPMIIGHGIVKFTVQGKEVTLPRKKIYES